MELPAWNLEKRSNFFNQNSADGMFSAFTDTFENASRKYVQKQKTF